MYTLLKRQNRQPRTPAAVLSGATLAQVRELLPLEPALWAIDLETKGTDAADPACEVVGIGFANAERCFYVDWTTCSQPAREHVQEFLAAVNLTAFNVLFDGAFLQVLAGRWLTWASDSYALFKQLSTEGWPGQRWDLETAQREVLGWNYSNKTLMDQALKDAGLGKADMWKLPVEVLGGYCASDADAAWQLHHELLTQAAAFPQLIDYHTRIFLPQVQLLAEQQLRGIQIDKGQLTACHTELLEQIQSSLDAFLTSPEVAHHIQARNQEVLDVWRASEPPRLNKDGSVSKRWEAWRNREQAVLKKGGFNPNSKKQLGVLFYDKLGHKCIKFTKTGKRVIDRKVLPGLGVHGKLLAKYNTLLKRRGYVERVIDKSSRDGLIHPQFNSVGTFTTRLGGSGGLNLQQLYKEPSFLSSFAARPGFALVQADAEALEPTVLAEFSQDATLMKLYGPDAKPNDVYLFVSAQIEALGQEIRKYYDFENPTPEGIKAAKKHCKNDRAVGKKFHLMSTYKAGPPRIQEDMAMEGIVLPLRKVREIHRDYWKLWPGVLKFEETLKDMWTANRGWFPSVLGTPICVAESLLKDVNNRFCQTSGHLILQLWISNVQKLRIERGVEMYPYIVNIHDEMIWEAPIDQAPAAAQILADALAMTNEELSMGIKIKGPAVIAKNLAEIKCENYNEWKEARNAQHLASAG